MTTRSFTRAWGRWSTQPLVVLGVDDSPPRRGDGHQRHVLDLADVSREGERVGLVVRGALGHAAAELDQERRHRGPVVGVREPDSRDLPSPEGT